jgi:hypothetical protein
MMHHSAGKIRKKFYEGQLAFLSLVVIHHSIIHKSSFRITHPYTLTPEADRLPGGEHLQYNYFA